jgi:hypothetical protein
VSATATRVQSPEQLGRARGAASYVSRVNRAVVIQLEHGKSTVQFRIVLLLVQVLGVDFELRTRG